MRRHTLRTYTGRYKRERFWNRDRKTWFEVMCLVNISVWGMVAADLSPVAEAYYSAPKKYELVNPRFIDDRGDSFGDGSSPSDIPDESTGETVSAVSESKPRESVEGSAPAMENAPSAVEAKILKAWEGTGKGHIAVAVAKSESGLRSNAIGWNCHYTIQGMKYSKACNPEDRPKAWSVDCGVMQINHLGKTCPSHLFNPDENIRIGRDMFNNRGFSPWVAFTRGLYLKNL